MQPLFLKLVPLRQLVMPWSILWIHLQRLFLKLVERSLKQPCRLLLSSLAILHVFTSLLPADLLELLFLLPKEFAIRFVLLEVILPIQSILTEPLGTQNLGIPGSGTQPSGVNLLSYGLPLSLRILGNTPLGLLQLSRLFLPSVLLTTLRTLPPPHLSIEPPPTAQLWVLQIYWARPM